VLSYAPTDILVVFALEEETGGQFDALASPVLFTGVGKINATWSLTRALERQRPHLVLNFGTAGSRRFPVSTLVECSAYIQRDMDASPLGFTAGVTPYDTLPATLALETLFDDLPTGVCGTGDHFVSGHETDACDLFDMEGYALAKVCRRAGVRFASVKYVSDGGDADAPDAWRDNLKRAARAFHQRYQILLKARPA
jgi:adenosylhomocysteine nucleosidase